MRCCNRVSFASLGMYPSRRRTGQACQMNRISKCKNIQESCAHRALALHIQMLFSRAPCSDAPAPRSVPRHSLRFSSQLRTSSAQRKARLARYCSGMSSSRVITRYRAGHATSCRRAGAILGWVRTLGLTICLERPTISLVLPESRWQIWMISMSSLTRSGLGCRRLVGLLSQP